MLRYKQPVHCFHPVELQKVYEGRGLVLFLIYSQSQKYARAKAGTKNVSDESTQLEPSVEGHPLKLGEVPLREE